MNTNPKKKLLAGPATAAKAGTIVARAMATPVASMGWLPLASTRVLPAMPGMFANESGIPAAEQVKILTAKAPDGEHLGCGSWRASSRPPHKKKTPGALRGGHSARETEPVSAARTHARGARTRLARETEPV
eukprot:4227941-Prymnesium_polylepis.2